MRPAERLLKLLLRVAGGVCASALVAVFMPTGWMAWSHEAMGLGSWPVSPVAEYLARLTSGLYALLGVLMWIAASDVRRHRHVITAVAIGFGALSVVGAASGGMPVWWVVGDLVTALGFAAVVLILQAGVPSVRGPG